MFNLMQQFSIKINVQTQEMLQPKKQLDVHEVTLGTLTEAPTP